MTAAPPDTLQQRETADRRAVNRHRRPRRGARKGVAVAAAGVVGLAALGAGWYVLGRPGGTAVADDRGHRATPGAPAPAATGAGHTQAPSAQGDTLPAAIPGLGPKTRAAIPAHSTQVLVASGKAKNSSQAVVTLWTRTPDGHWKAGAAWPAHNALRGWTTSHHAGDLHSPIGVFTLHDAGGFDPDPDSKLPYHHSSRFRAGGTGFEGEPLDQAFDYVIAIDYNRVPGTSPLDGEQPLGPSRGGGIWVHVDHGGPTHGCVSIAAAHMVDLLHTLTPGDHPVIVMGDKQSLAA